MQMALFLKIQTGSDIYLLDTMQVDRVIPLLPVRRIPGAAEGLAGIIHYQGAPLPVLDLCELFLGRPAARHLSTRLIVVRAQSAEAIHPGRLVGLLAEQVMDTIRLTPEDFIAGIRGERTRYLGSMANTSSGLGQRIELDELLNAQRLAKIFGSGGAPT
jgi:chemotaxis-related protein WspB